MVTQEGGVECSPHQGKNRGQKSFQKEVDALQLSFLLPQSLPTIVDCRVQIRSEFVVVVIVIGRMNLKIHHFGILESCVYASCRSSRI